MECLFLLLVVTRLGVGYVFCILNWRIDHASIAAAVHPTTSFVKVSGGIL